MDVASTHQLDAADLKGTPRLRRLKPLDPARREIRLIQLLDHDIRLSIHSLDEKPAFHALSYYWGPAIPTRDVRIQGEEVAIRQTVVELFDSLRRRYSRDSLFWMDMLCVDQHKMSERNSQVTLMSDIFSGAVDVISWLGIAHKSSKTAFELIRDNIGPEEASPAQERDTESRADRLAVSPEHIDNTTLTAFQSIANRKYWSRVWVAQEAILARDCWVLCGDDLANLNDLCEIGLPWMEQSQSRNEDGHYIKFPNVEIQDAINAWATIRNIVRYRELFHTENNIMIRSVLETFAKNDCTNPVDKVYGLRALNRDLSAIEVDYSKSPMEVYLSVLHQGLLHLDKGRAFQTLPRLLFDLGIAESNKLPDLIAKARNADMPIPVDGQIIGEVVSAAEHTGHSTDKQDEVGICVKMTALTSVQPSELISPFTQYVCGYTYQAADRLPLLARLLPEDLIIHVEGYIPIIVFLRPITLGTATESKNTVYSALGNFRETRVFSPADFEDGKKAILSQFATMNAVAREGEIVFTSSNRTEGMKAGKTSNDATLDVGDVPQHWRTQGDYESTMSAFMLIALRCKVCYFGRGRSGSTMSYRWRPNELS